jgi:F0F1-type ATP synthase membrane subunit c/vacuolar-type H+-ATPase subunit K
MVQVLNILGNGFVLTGFIGVGVGIGVVFRALFSGVAINPSLRFYLLTLVYFYLYAWDSALLLDSAFVEATCLFALPIGLSSQTSFSTNPESKIDLSNSLHPYWVTGFTGPPPLLHRTTLVVGGGGGMLKVVFPL